VRVLLVRLDGVGDAAVCVPLVAGLRAAGHEVGVALTTRNAGLFTPHAICAEHVLERIPWPAHGSTPASTARARDEIAAMRYDAALVASEEPEAYALAQPIPLRIGFTTGWARPLKTLWVRRRVTRAISRHQRSGSGDAHEVEILYRLGAGLVASSEPSADAAVLRTVLADGHAAPPRAGVLLQAGAKWRSTGVPDDVLRRVVAALEPRGLRVVAAPEEAAAASKALGVTAQTFASLRDWVTAIDGAETVITVDTGAAHVAGMLGVRVLDVFPQRDFGAQVRRWRPWAAPYSAFPASAVTGGAGRPLIEAAFDGD
jgi:ADP-heptose:LPS heptosyltransferase